MTAQDTPNGVPEPAKTKSGSPTPASPGVRAGPLSISMDEFAKVELKVGKIVSVEDIPTARKPIYKLTVDFGGFNRQCAAGIKDRYSKEDLLGKVVVAVVNLAPKAVAGVSSECMLLAAFNATELALLSPDRAVALGSKVS